jgi:hypothetical protein
MANKSAKMAFGILTFQDAIRLGQHSHGPYMQT